MGDFIVKTDIPWGEALAYTRGQTVSADAVKDNGWEEHVVSASTKEAREIKAEVTGRPVSDFEPTTTTGRAAASNKEG